mmetsp:Transcript_51339/g.142081  ORF Transcript_51339/g.142081 Transcript_51339/m.142081 type:complete len:260 (-) Transcript_51339:145-924(-)
MSSTGAGYDQSTTTYSPDGRMFQVEYAAKAVEASGTAVGVKCKDGIVLGVEKILISKMLVAGSNRRIHTIDRHLGVALSGLAADGRQLALRAMDEARGYRTNYSESIPPRVLSDRMGSFMHAYTCYWYLRPFGASIIMAGYDADRKAPELYMSDPSGHSLRYHGVAVGKGARAAKTEIEKLKFGDKTCREALGLVAKVLHTTHDEMNTKPFELELSWLSEETGWTHKSVPKELVTEADAWAKAQIEEEEKGSDSDDDDD